MKKLVKIAALVGLIAFGLIQFVRPDRSNPDVNPAETLEASVSVPADVKMVLARSCGDCHTNETYYPWYANVAPVSWLLAKHIREGREELNFSRWGAYSDRQKAKKFEEICEQVSEDEMPLPSYLWIHRDAALTESDKKLLCDWANGEANKVR